MSSIMQALADVGVSTDNNSNSSDSGSSFRELHYVDHIGRVFAGRGGAGDAIIHAEPDRRTPCTVHCVRRTPGWF
jgi:hypothetical protein